MGLFKWIKSIQKKFFGGILFWRPGDAVFFKGNYRQSAKEGFLTNPYVYAAIRERASAVSVFTWQLFDDTNPLKPKEILSHQILDLLENPNPLMSGSAFFEWLMGYYDIAGREFILSVGAEEGGAGVPKELWPLQPDTIEVVTGPASMPIAGFKMTGKSGELSPTIPAERVMYLHSFNPLEPFGGTSPIAVGRTSITQNNESKNWNVALLQNMARPPGGFMAQGNLTETQFNRLQEQVEDRYASPENAGRPFLGEGGIKWESFGLSPADMDWLEGQKLSAREIAILYQVPPEMLGDASNKTYANYQEARKAFYQETILPIMVWLREELNRWLVPKFETGRTKLRLDFDKDNVPALQEDRTELFKRLNEAMFLDINEKREEVGKAPKPGGDVLLVPLNLVPLSMASDDGGEEPPDDEDDEQERARRLRGKAFNLANEEQKLVYWKTIDRRRERFFERVRGMLSQRLRADWLAAKRVVQKATNPEGLDAAVATAVTAKRKQWEQLFRALYMTVGDEFAREVFAQIKASGGAPERRQDEVFRDRWLKEIDEWVQANSATRILGIQDTTIRQLQNVIAKGIEAGQSIAQIAKGIADAQSVATGFRATRIARTEVISASNLGSLAAAKATNLPLRKEWIATPDDRTRASHQQADGDIVDGMDSTFLVQGEELLFPGDTSHGATADNVINCRCTLAYITMENDDGT